MRLPWRLVSSAVWAGGLAKRIGQTAPFHNGSHAASRLACSFRIRRNWNHNGPPILDAHNSSFDVHRPSENAWLNNIAPFRKQMDLCLNQPERKMETRMLLQVVGERLCALVNAVGEDRDPVIGEHMLHRHPSPDGHAGAVVLADLDPVIIGEAVETDIGVDHRAARDLQTQVASGRSCTDGASRRSRESRTSGPQFDKHLPVLVCWA
jgi:hypothetical protein